MIGVLLLVVLRLLPGSPFGVYALEEGYNYHERNGIHSKCSFFDTVNLTGYTAHSNGSYTYQGVLIPSHYVGTYDYIYKDLVDRIDVAPHPRGCVCKLRPCINLCCPWGQIYSDGCKKATKYLWPEPTINVTLNNGSLQTVNIYEQFMVQTFRPCMEMFALVPEVDSADNYQMFENGRLYREVDGLYLHSNEYCLTVTRTNLYDNNITINPANCNPLKEIRTLKFITSYAMLFSIPFMLMTIVVYLMNPELRNHHGMSLVCYLIGLAVGYSILCYLLLLHGTDPLGIPCKLYGYTAYFSFMSAFFWLNAISFDLWHNFRGPRVVNGSQSKKRFLLYAAYSWGSAFIFLIFTVYAQEYSKLPDDLKPGIGGGENCWLDLTNWSAMVYFFAPILIIIVANTIMFVMTAIRIHGVQREMERIIARGDSSKNLRTEKDKYGLFLRLFIIMGVTWSSEIIMYFIGSDQNWSLILYVTELCNASQGFLIFMLFVMKKKVKQFIMNRMSFHELQYLPTNNTPAARFEA